MTAKSKALNVFMIALVVTLMAAGALQAQGQRSVFSWVVADRVTVRGDTAVEGALDVGGAVTVASDITQSNGDLTVADDLTLTAQTAITVTTNMTLTPTGTYQPLRSAGTTGTTIITAGAAGDVLILENMVNTSIIFTDTGTLKLGGTRTLGQYDTLTLISDGTNWIEVAFVNN